ncbi:hypothetical protein N0V90_002950 [Kalmusia sp. IMI 367209]|nr:hypothetical protein N0V90_002950 [Kalmusia sp. IMI 367209]
MNLGTSTTDTEFEDTEAASSARKRKRGAIEHALPAPKRNKTVVREKNLQVLCKDCQQIDFQKVLDADVLSLQEEMNGILLADLGTRCNDLAPTTECPLCHLFFQSRLTSKDPSPNYQLRIYSYLKTSRAITFDRCREWHLAKDIPCLGVVPIEARGETFRLEASSAGHIFCSKEDPQDDLLFKPRVLGQNADLSQVKDWLNFCASHHPLCQNRESRVTGLKLLDCETFDVVPAPANASYVALSYVWGTEVTHNETPAMEYGEAQDLDPRITKTMRDAAVAAKSLGYKYLWIDKLCIDQGNADEKHHQISHMDLIYGSADLTIIAACGQDSHYGLPGVNGTPRTSQRLAKFGQTSVFSSMLHPYHHIQSSKWAGRGWTLQEAVLSTRRLVFTDDQLYFECDTMQCSENIVPNLNLIHDFRKDKEGVFSCFQSGILSINMGRRFGKSRPKYWSELERPYMDLIVQYTKRTLTFEEDRPNAFAGIMRHFAKKNIFQIWGVAYKTGASCIHDKFTRGLLWAHRNHADQTQDARYGEHFSVDMTLSLPDPASIPSWSWMGWRGEITFPYSSSMMDSKLHRIRLELGPDSWAELDDYHSTTSSTSEQVLSYHITPPKVLLLDVDCVNASKISIDEFGSLTVYGQEAICYISCGTLQPKALSKLFRQGKLELLEITYNMFTGNHHFMIVRNRADFFVRIGICVVRIPRIAKQPGQRKSIRLG